MVAPRDRKNSMNARSQSRHPVPRPPCSWNRRATSEFGLGNWPTSVNCSLRLSPGQSGAVQTSSVTWTCRVISRGKKNVLESPSQTDEHVAQYKPSSVRDDHRGHRAARAAGKLLAALDLLLGRPRGGGSREDDRPDLVDEHLLALVGDPERLAKVPDGVLEDARFGHRAASDCRDVLFDAASQRRQPQRLEAHLAVGADERLAEGRRRERQVALVLRGVAPLELLRDMVGDGRVRADTVCVHLGQQVGLAHPGRRLGAAPVELHFAGREALAGLHLGKRL